jgi:hypothetical protein
MFLEQKIKDPVQIFRHTMGQRKATLEEKTKKNPFRDTKSCTSANSFPQSHEDTQKKKKIKLTTIRMTIKYKLYKVYSKQNQQILKHN